MRKQATKKPVTKSTKSVKSVAAKSAPVKTEKPSVSAGKLARDAKNIHAQRTNFGKQSTRDDCYLRELRDCGATVKQTVTLAQIAAKFGDDNPHAKAAGFASYKSTDTGAFVRLIKSGRVIETAPGTYRLAK